MPNCMDVEWVCGKSIKGIDTCIVLEARKEYKRPKKIENTIEFAWREAIDYVERETAKLIREELGKGIYTIFANFETHKNDTIRLEFGVRDSDLSGTAVAKYHVKKFNKFIEWVNPDTDRIERIKWEHEAYYIESICVFVEIYIGDMEARKKLI